MTSNRKHIMTTKHYDDAEVPLSAPMLKMAIKQNQVSKYSNITRLSLANTTKDISPFLVMDLTEDQVASINEYDEALTRASYVTLQDIKNLKNLMNPDIPDISDKFMLMLKWYTNLNLDLFSKTIPFF